jgi:hypothetical protein
MERVRPHEPSAGQRDRSSELELFSGQFAPTAPEEAEESEQARSFTTDSPVCISCGTELAPQARVRYPPVDPVTSRFCPKCGAERNAWVAQEKQKRQTRGTRKIFMKGMVISLAGAFVCMITMMVLFWLRSNGGVDLTWFDTAEDGLEGLTVLFTMIHLMFKLVFQLSDSGEE